ncbi:MAG: ABC transporter ATP-binding protein [Pirellulales bacterium]
MPAPESASSIATALPDAPLLRVEGLKTYFRTDRGIARAVDGVSFSIERGKSLAIVGESGCGKTVTALSILQLIPMPPGEITGGSILLEGRDLLQVSAGEMRKIRGGEIAMIFQEPGTSLNPVFTIGKQIGEAIRLHRNLDARATRAEIIRVLTEVRISEPERRMNQYPHELSGGMKQRAMIAMAIACQPKLMIADEPTTALDVTIQARILDLLRSMQAQHEMSILLITHDLGVVAEMADEVVVMYAGKVVEHADVGELFAHPKHPYTRGLFASLPRIDLPSAKLTAIEGNVPSPTRFPAGCRFKTRCPHAQQKCDSEPPLETHAPGHEVACWFAGELFPS